MCMCVLRCGYVCVSVEVDIDVDIDIDVPRRSFI